MRVVTVKKYQTYFGRDYDTIVECQLAERTESLERYLVDTCSFYYGVEARDMASNMANRPDVLKEILAGDYTSVMTEEEKAEADLDLIEPKEGRLKS